MLHDLYTDRGERLTGTPWQVYPRPQMKRDSYINLNGEWEFSAGDPVFDRKIRVPYCPESLLSGIHTHFGEGVSLWYRKKVTLPGDFIRGRVLLHIGAADQIADVYVNDIPVGHHEGGYEAFFVDITAALQMENTITIRCLDDLNDQSFPYGKQVLPGKRGGMWYTPVSGIWQTVWLESVPETYIEKLTIENRGYSVTIDIGKEIPGVVSVRELGEFPLENGKVTITPEVPVLWSPEDPYLYHFTVTAGEDQVESYFAIRSLEVKKVGAYPRLCLNGKPYFFHGLLDQGYWPDGLFTPAAPECYADDILAMKKLGFNTLRKHIKVEPEEFYYQCDKLGMIVWQDLVNNSDYNFIRDTALPTIGIQKLDDRKLHPDEISRRRIKESAEAAVRQLQNHPCICYWTIFNEGWGQFDSDSVYEWFRTLDDTRFIDTTSGWFRRKKTDVDSRHVYFRKVKLKGDGKKPLVLSEFGGKTYKAEGHIFNPDKSYGYGGCETLEELNEAVAKLYLEEILPCIRDGLCAAIYTQVSDVEDEINGLLTYDRKVEKLRPEVMLPVAEQLQQAISFRQKQEDSLAEARKLLEQENLNLEDLEPGLQKKMGYLLAQNGLSKGTSGFHHGWCQADIPMPFRVCGWADYIQPGWGPDQGVAFRIEAGCFDDEQPTLYYEDDANWPWGDLNKLQIVRECSSGISDVHLEIRESEEADIWGKKEEETFVVFRLDPKAVKQFVTLNGKQASTEDVGKHIFVLPRCGEFYCTLGELRDGKKIPLHKDDFCMK